jgi:hypothetical protein
MEMTSLKTSRQKPLRASEGLTKTPKTAVSGTSVPKIVFLRTAILGKVTLGIVIHDESDSGKNDPGKSDSEKNNSEDSEPEDNKHKDSITGDNGPETIMLRLVIQKMAIK